MASDSADLSSNITATPTPPATNGNGVDSSKAAAANVTKPVTADGGDGLFTGFIVNDGMLMRVTYVLLGLTLVLVIYFGVKFWRLRRRKTNIRRYDVLTTQRVATDIGIDSGSEDELFDDAQAKLVRAPNGGSRNSSR